MDDRLRALLDYDGILSAVASTEDGLVIGTAGIDGDDAEIVAAGGTALVSSLRSRGEQSAAVEVGGGQLHMLLGDEVSLLLLTEPTVPHELVVGLMSDALEHVAGVLY